MLREALDFVLSFSTRNRPPVQALNDGSHRALVYSDAAQRYEELVTFLPRTRGVSNVESFAAMVLEEARRIESDGHWMTVVFNAGGAKLFVDDRDHRTVFGYDRALAPQWVALTRAMNKGLEHVDFVRLLQRLRPSIVAFPAVYPAFRKVSLGKGVAVESAPTLEDGKSGGSYRVEVQVNGRTAQAALPQTIAFRLPFARGSAQAYDVDAEVDVSLVEKAIQFTLILPEIESVAEQAIADEVAWFREQVKSLPLLCVLEDY